MLFTCWLQKDIVYTVCNLIAWSLNGETMKNYWHKRRHLYTQEILLTSNTENRRRGEKNTTWDLKQSQWVSLREHNLCDIDRSVHNWRSCDGVHQPMILQQLSFGATLCRIQMLMAVWLLSVIVVSFDWTGRVAPKFNWDLLLSMLRLNNSQILEASLP